MHIHTHEPTCIVMTIIPVKIFWKAASTLVESNADVSINDSAFFSVKRNTRTSVPG